MNRGEGSIHGGSAGQELVLAAAGGVHGVCADEDEEQGGGDGQLGQDHGEEGEVLHGGGLIAIAIGMIILGIMTAIRTLQKLAAGRVLSAGQLGGPVYEAGQCCVCLSREAEVALAPCRHRALCRGCYPDLLRGGRCPLCRAAISGVCLW
jgi:hypothetical protein